ncbi:MAG: hypothetical protein WBB43_26940 [Limnoraphis sp.]
MRPHYGSWQLLVILKHGVRMDVGDRLKALSRLATPLTLPRQSLHATSNLLTVRWVGSLFVALLG